MRDVSPGESNWTGVSEERPYSWHAERADEVRRKYLRPAEEIVKQVEPDRPSRIFATTCYGAVGRTGYAAGLAHGLGRVVRATEGAVWMNTDGAELEERWASVPTAAAIEPHDGLTDVLGGGTKQRVDFVRTPQWRDIQPNGRFSTRLDAAMFDFDTTGEICL